MADAKKLSKKSTEELFSILGRLGQSRNPKTQAAKDKLREEITVVIRDRYYTKIAKIPQEAESKRGKL